MSAVLVPLNGGAPISLDKAIIFFGRGSECDVILTDSRKVSRKHCCIAQIDNRIVVRDLGSMNGVRINDAPVHEEGKLNLGDVLWVGDLGFRLDVGKPGIKRAPVSIPPAPRQQVKTSPQAPVKRDSDLDSPLYAVEKDLFEPKERIGASRQIPDEEIIELSEDDIVEPDAK